MMDLLHIYIVQHFRTPKELSLKACGEWGYHLLDPCPILCDLSTVIERDDYLDRVCTQRTDAISIFSTLKLSLVAEILLPNTLSANASMFTGEEDVLGGV